MKQFDLVPASVYHSTAMCTQSVTKLELATNQADQNLTYQIVSLKKEINKKLFVKADSSDNKILSRPPIKLSKLQTLILDGVETGSFCQTLLNNCDDKTQKITTFLLPFLTLMEYLQLWFSIRLPKQKRKEAGSLSKFERQKWLRLYTVGAAAYGTVRNSSKAGNMPVARVRQILHSKTSYT